MLNFAYFKSLNLSLNSLLRLVFAAMLGIQVTEGFYLVYQVVLYAFNAGYSQLATMF